MKRFAVLLGALLIAPSAGVANASTALLLGGKGIYAELSDEQMENAFGGYFAEYDRRVNVPFPGKEFYSSVKVGTENLYNAVYDPQYAGPKTIGGVSEGAFVALAADDVFTVTPPRDSRDPERCRN